MPLELGVPSKIQWQRLLVEQAAPQAELVTRPPQAVPAWLGQIEVGCSFDPIGNAVGNFIGVVPHALAVERASGGALATLAMPVGDHGVVSFKFDQAAGLGRV